MHAVIEKKLSYILNEVSANGNPGLDNSLKDLYQGQKAIQAKLEEIHSAIKPELDKAAWWKATKQMVLSSAFYRFHSTKPGFIVLLLMVFGAVWLITGNAVATGIATIMPAVYALFKDILK